ncbi:MAG: tyrosine-type recombinase/integrase [Chloroflexi bacterium]|nr:tyrosine-type recombinase/integrase [Chloroflexota bacterium]
MAARNRAILLLLLDTGMRASELCGHVTGKGMKDRYVPIGARARQVLWEYVNLHRNPRVATNLVFMTRHDKPLNGTSLAHILWELGKRAGVEGCHPHRFRHTAARLYLRNGGDVMSLQQILGHEDLATTRIYIQLEQEDIERTHERASPVDRMGL